MQTVKQCQSVIPHSFILGHNHHVVEEAVYGFLQARQRLQRMGVVALLEQRQYLVCLLLNLCGQRFFGGILQQAVVYSSPTLSPPCLARMFDTRLLAPARAKASGSWRKASTAFMRRSKSSGRVGRRA